MLQLSVKGQRPMKSNKKRGIFAYKSYNFVDKDPVLDIEKTVVQRSGMSFKEIHEAGGATPGTLNKHFNGATKTSRFDTLMATFRACGGDIEFVMPKTGQRVKIPKAAPKK
jgi:predicted transcriptional regulator